MYVLVKVGAAAVKHVKACKSGAEGSAWFVIGIVAGSQRVEGAEVGHDPLVAHMLFVVSEP